MDRPTLLIFVLGALLIASAIYLSRRSSTLGIIVGGLGFYIALLPVTVLYSPDAPMRDLLQTLLAEVRTQAKKRQLTGGIPSGERPWPFIHATRSVRAHNVRRQACAD